MQIIGLVLLLTCLPSTLIDFALPQWKKEPQTQIEDAYKWIYQATRGGEHAVTDKEMAREWLESEWQTLDKPQANEPLWQPLCPDGEIGRFNLRTFRAGGGRVDELLEAFIKSSQEFENSETNFRSAWKNLGIRLKKHSEGTLKWADWQKLERKMAAQNYPAIHHSRAYEQASHPAYRVLTKQTADTLLIKLN